MQNVGIVGARKYKDKQSVIDLIHSLPVDSVIVTSSCRGVCTWAGEEAKVIGLKVRIYSPDLTNVANRLEMVERYYQRNRELISGCGIVHAFVSQEDGLTGGTRYEVQYAKRLNKELVLHWENGKIQKIFQKSLPFIQEEKDFSAGWMNFFSETLGQTP